jgi:hypothetical protein
MISVAERVSDGDTVPGIEQVVPGRLATEHWNVTVPVKPLAGVTVTVAVPTFPAVIVKLAGEMVRVKVPLLASACASGAGAANSDVVAIVNCRDALLLFASGETAVICSV